MMRLLYKLLKTLSQKQMSQRARKVKRIASLMRLCKLRFMLMPQRKCY